MNLLLKVKKIVKEQNLWRSSCLNLIASENLLSPLAQNYLISVFLGRYNEHSTKNGKFVSHYQGTKFANEIEKICNKIFSQKFKTPFVDTRPISGAIANLIVYHALLKPGDTFLAPGLTFGAHVSSTQYGIAGVCGLKSIDLPFDEKNFQIDLERAIPLIKKTNPKLIMLGRSMFLRPEPIKEIRKETDATIVYDASHVFGLIFGESFQDPFNEGADIITSSTHKTFPGPQGGIILAKKDFPTDFWRKIQRAIFPGTISNHHIFRLPALAICALEMKKFGKEYAKQTIKNAKVLAESLFNFGFDVLGKSFGFTQSHQIIVNVQKFGGGEVVAKKLEKANIIVNKMALPTDTPKDATKNPSGIRIGTQEITRIGMKENEMKEIAKFFKEILIEKRNPEKIKKKVMSLKKNFQKIHYCF
ncbi:serine hydroxymethyltransferase [Candidatus Parcubacteria bacterium]|nr:serine hydroxymethyltransferase [Candidatus Parcubacteria bacterium]